MKESKLNVLLAKTDALAVAFKNGIKDYIKFFKSSQGAFQGNRKTYSPKDDSIDEPSRRGTTLVQTTVGEKLKWLEESSKEYLDALFAQEATNASGKAKAQLIVDGTSWGEFTSLELLRLKGLLENGDLKVMYELIPVRSDSEEWSDTTAEMYEGRTGIYESPKITYTHKTTEKENYILEDPNVSKLGTKSYTPQVATKVTTRILGEGSHQNFSGQWSHRQRAELLKRRSDLHIAVIEALKKANECEIVKSELTSERIFNYLHGR